MVYLSLNVSVCLFRARTFNVEVIKGEEFNYATDAVRALTASYGTTAKHGYWPKSSRVDITSNSHKNMVLYLIGSVFDNYITIQIIFAALFIYMHTF